MPDQRVVFGEAFLGRLDIAAPTFRTRRGNAALPPRPPIPKQGVARRVRVRVRGLGRGPGAGGAPAVPAPEKPARHPLFRAAHELRFIRDCEAFIEIPLTHIKVKVERRYRDLSFEAVDRSGAVRACDTSKALRLRRE
jgi:hypothetical protein